MANNGQSEIGAIDFFNLLPEGCIANAVSLTSPRDACRLSLVGSTFRSAAESDAVWERFLPSDYQDIIARSVNRDPDDESSSQPPLAFPRKKELYFHLSDHPLIIDSGTKSFSLDKMSGKKCYMLAATDLAIVWGDTPIYWQWTSLPESRFKEVAELVKVCWLEIRGKIGTRMLSPDTIYAAYLVFNSKAGTFGFEDYPAQVSVGICGGESKTRTVYLDPESSQQHVGVRRTRWPNHRGMGIMMRPQVRRDEGQYPKRRGDGWLEVELGEYVSNSKNGEENAELEMSVMEVRGGNWKSGLIVEGIEIRPKVADAGK
ncbi:hypothetical protein LguiA_016556 [Lonicera macranthoides]